MSRLISLIIVLAAAAPCSAQLVIGVDDADPNRPSALAYNFDTQQWVELFRGREIWGIAADDQHRKIYIASSANSLYVWNYDDLGQNVAPTLIGSFTNVANGAIINFVSLAYDPNTGLLYATRNISSTNGPEGLYSIDPNNAGSTLIMDYADADWDLGGLDVNPDDGLFYATNDDATPFGTGLFKSDIEALTWLPVLVPIPPFTGSNNDIDGLAIGRRGGKTRAYFVVDDAGQIGVYNLTDGETEAPLTNPWTRSETFAGGAWAAALFGAPPPCPGDADGDRDVDQDDIDLVLFNYGTTQPPGTNGDLDGDGDVDQDDIDTVLFNYGTSC